MAVFFQSGVCMQPANFGPLRGADGNARVLGPCGDTLEFWVSVYGGIITDARYTSDGCFNSNKCGSTAALLARGLPVEEAEQLSQADILAAAKDVAEDSVHCALLAANALKAAIADWRIINHAALRTGEKKEAVARSILKPMPKLLVSCRGTDGKDNALVVGYGGNCSYDPPTVMVGIVPSRYSYHIIKETNCFVVNLVTAAQKEIYDYFGSHSGRDGDKFVACGAKTANGCKVNAPILSDCPVNIECTVTGSFVTGSHEMFIGKIEHVHADAEMLKPDGTVDWEKIRLL